MLESSHKAATGPLIVPHKKFLDKLIDKIIILSAELLHNNSVTPLAYCIFILFEYLCILMEPIRMMAAKIDPGN